MAHGYDVLTLKCNVNNWYQDLSAETLASIFEKLPRYQKTITYGSTMGGYAAMYFAHVVGADVCIALSPQISIDPGIAPFEPRWVADSARINFTHKPLSEVMAHAIVTYYVIFDPQTPDRQHADAMLASSNNVILVPVMYSGHPSDMMLDDMGMLAGTVDSLAEGVFPQLRLAIRANRRNSAGYLFALAQRCLGKKRMVVAEKLLAQASEITDRTDIHLAYSQVLLQQGKPERALEILNSAWSRFHVDSHLSAYRAHLLYLNGQAEEALDAFEGAIARQPDFLPFYKGERLMFKEIVQRYQNEGRVRNAALARARAELELEHGKVETVSRPAMIGAALLLVGIIILLISLSIVFRLV